MFKLSKFFIALQSSVFFKILAVFLLTGFVINTIVGMFYRFALENRPREIYSKGIHQFLYYIAQDIGSPPNLKRAKEITRELPLEIRIERQISKDDTGSLPLRSKKNKTADKRIYQVQVPKWTWSSDTNLESIDQHERHFWDKHRRYGKHRRHLFKVVDYKGYQFLFTSNFKHFVEIDKGYFVLLFFLVTAVLIGAYFSIKWVLRPIQWLYRGVNQVSTGNFDEKIPTRKKDELGELSIAFNKMTEQIKNMIKAKEQLLLDVSHELRSPLTRMKVALEGLPEKTQKKSIREDIEEMENMITELLESERLGAPHGGLQLEQIDLLPLIHELVLNFQNDNSVQVDLREAPPSLVLNIDQRLIRVLISNLLDNASKYAEGVPKKIQLHFADQSDSTILSVVNRGPQIPAEELPLIFEPFYRIDKSRSKKTGGYGLGLSLCKKIIEAHGGKIEIESTQERETRVKVTFIKMKKA